MDQFIGLEVVKRAYLLEFRPCFAEMARKYMTENSLSPERNGLRLKLGQYFEESFGITIEECWKKAEEHGVFAVHGRTEVFKVEWDPRDFLYLNWLGIEL